MGSILTSERIDQSMWGSNVLFEGFYGLQMPNDCYNI